LKAKQAKDSARNSRTASTPVMVVRKSDRRIACVGTGSVSSRPCSGCSSNANSQHMPALTSMVPRQPSDCASVGPAEPPSRMPTGMAVWVMENAKGA
jgi:hypothetical protein